MSTEVVVIKDAIGVILTISGLIPIYVQLALQVGWIKANPPLQRAEEGLEGIPQVPESAIKLLDKLLDNAGWMVVVGILLIYFGLRCLGVGVFGT